MPSIVWVRSVLKNACALGQLKPVALPCSSALITSSWRAAESFRSEGFLARHISWREGRMRAGEADESPAGEVLVAAIDRVGKHAFDRVGAQRVEERLRARPAKARGLALLERADHLVLARGGKLQI